MGYIHHTAIIVNDWKKDRVNEAHKFCIISLESAEPGYSKLVTPITEQIVNAGFSFAILPDGSKLGWEDRYKCDIARSEICKYLKKNEIDFVMVSFGRDIAFPKIDDKFN